MSCSRCCLCHSSLASLSGLGLSGSVFSPGLRVMRAASLLAELVFCIGGVFMEGTFLVLWKLEDVGSFVLSKSVMCRFVALVVLVTLVRRMLFYR
jgi:hypothetical protein